MTQIRLENTLSIPASGIAFASGLSLIGTAVAGPLGGVTGAVIGAVGGILAEVVSQKKHEQPKAQKTETTIGEIVIEKQVKVVEVAPQERHKKLEVTESEGE